MLSPTALGSSSSPRSVTLSWYRRQSLRPSACTFAASLSTRAPVSAADSDGPSEFWSPDLFKEELAELTRHLGIEKRYAVVGQSWGGMLAMEYALKYQQHLKGLVISNMMASIPAYNAYARFFRRIPLPREGGALDQTFIAFLALCV